MHPKRLTEKGFGSETFGVATVVADINGKPVNARPVKMPDGSIGGEIFLLNKKYQRENTRPYIYGEDVYQLIVNRRNLAGEVKVIAWDISSDFPQPTEFSTLFDIVDNSPRVLSDNSLGSIECKELVTTILWDAFFAAINRSMTAKPDSAFYAIFAKNAKMAERKIVEKKIHVTA